MHDFKQPLAPSFRACAEDGPLAPSFRGARSASPESITTIRDYGFRACAEDGASRNDEDEGRMDAPRRSGYSRAGGPSAHMTRVCCRVLLNSDLQFQTAEPSRSRGA